MPAFRNRQCSETLAYKIQTPGNYPEESIQYYLYIMMLISTKNIQRSLKLRRFMEGAQSKGLSTVASSNSFSKSVISHFDRGKFSCNMDFFLFSYPSLTEKLWFPRWPFYILTLSFLHSHRPGPNFISSLPPTDNPCNLPA